MEVNLEYLDSINDETLLSDDDQVNYSSTEVLQMIEEAWVNEKFAPEILPHKVELVECLLDQISVMERNLENLSSKDFCKSIYQMEVDRVRFLVSSYLRTRLEKIEIYVNDIIHQEQQRNTRGEKSYLTIKELEFAKEFSKSKYITKKLIIYNA